MPYEADKAFAEEVVRSLDEGEDGPFLELMERYTPLLLGRAYQRVYDPEKVPDVLQSFWATLADRRTLRRYGGRSKLSTYLVGILDRQICTLNRKTRSGDLEDRGDMEREALRRLVRRAIERVSRQHPRCAEILWLRLLGLQYEGIARIELLREGKALTAKAVRSKTNAIKKLATRDDALSCHSRLRVAFEGLTRG